MSLRIGGLVLLVVAVLPLREPTELRSVLPTFSRVAFGCVLVDIISGTYQAKPKTIISTPVHQDRSSSPEMTNSTLSTSLLS